MHIGENVLSGTPEGKCILLAGAVVAAAGTFAGLRRLDEEQIPKAAVLGSAFFVASAIQVPLGGSSVHLILSGLMGLVLGWAVFPVVLVALILQIAFFSIGGPTVLGLNTVVMALPGVICYYLFGAAVRGTSRTAIYATGFAAGATGVILGAILSSSALLFTDRTFAVLAGIFLASHLPVALIEGFVTGSVVVLLRQVRPAVLRRPCRRWWKGRSMVKYVLPLMLLAPAPALAHTLYLFAQVRVTIVGRAYFPGNVAARQTDVIARDSSGRELGRTKTDDEGNFTLQADVRTDYHLTAETADGHSATLVVSAAEFPDVRKQSDRPEQRLRRARHAGRHRLYLRACRDRTLLQSEAEDLTFPDCNRTITAIVGYRGFLIVERQKSCQLNRSQTVRQQPRALARPSRLERQALDPWGRGRDRCRFPAAGHGFDPDD